MRGGAEWALTVRYEMVLSCILQAPVAGLSIALQGRVSVAKR
jgi:hypothetical protein